MRKTNKLPRAVADLVSIQKEPIKVEILSKCNDNSYRTPLREFLPPGLSMKADEDKRTTKILKVLGEVVRERRLDQRLSQKTLAEEANIHQTYLSELENGLRNPSLLVLVSLAEALELNLAEFSALLQASLKPKSKRLKGETNAKPEKAKRVLRANTRTSKKKS
ncbi:MAG TPA: helix-turn-helix transcriptional regulator [Candidatus Melainabacteria bacterium]|nr:helix-turn-helix transcriptional regulator [Candidatus Melainabacteria bacterium]